jgi:hypothetical protein
MAMRRIAILTTFAALAIPAAAQAATATTADGPLRYTAAAGETNNVSFVRVSGNTFRVTDLSAVIQAGTGCTQESPNVVSCTTRPGRSIIARLGDQDDVARSRTSRSVQLLGQAGRDTLIGASGRDALSGGDGDDTLNSGSSRDSLRGGAGNDTFLEGSTPNGADQVFGDSGFDTADYGARTGNLHIDLNAVRDDGDVRVNERDDVRTDRVVTGAGKDVLLGDDGGADTLVAGPGDDFLDGRRGGDSLDAGAGIDQIAARDLSADTIACGDGPDSVAADRLDVAAADCEKVRHDASMSVALAARAAYPTVLLKVVCPRTAFKACGGRVIIRTLKRVRTRSGSRILTVGVRRFAVAPGSERLVGVRIRAAAKPYLGRDGIVVRTAISAFDGAGPARKDAIRFRILRG